MPRELRIGMVGLDTSHCVAFTGILNDESNPHYIPGARVVAAYPSFSPDVEASHGRVEGFTEKLKTDYGVEMVEGVEALCERVDAVFIESVDGRRHLSEYRPVAVAGLPCFIDKPMTVSHREAKEIERLSKEHDARVFSSSSLRLVPEIQAAATDREGIGEIQAAHVFSPASLEPTNPGLYWYGVHGVEMLYTLMGPGCESLAGFSSDELDVVVAQWKDGRRATYSGTRLATHDYGAVVHGTEATRAFVCALQDIYVPLVERAVEFFRGAPPPVPIETTVEMMAFIEVAAKSEGKFHPIPL